MSEFTQPPPIRNNPPPVPAGAAPMTASHSSGSKAPTIIITAVVTAVLTSIFWLLAGAGFYAAFTSDPPPFEITIDAPEFMEIGDQTVMTVVISNGSDKAATLGSIDIMDTFMDGFEVISLDPKPSSKDSLFGIYSYYSRHKLEPGGSVTFKFTLKAKEIGYWTSSLDACTPMENFVSEWVEIEVLEKGGIAAMGEEEAELNQPESDAESGTE